MSNSFVLFGRNHRLQVFKGIEKKEGNYMGFQMSQIFPKDFVFTSRSVLIIHWHCFQVSYTLAQLKQTTNLHSEVPSIFGQIQLIGWTRPRVDV